MRDTRNDRLSDIVIVNAYLRMSNFAYAYYNAIFCESLWRNAAGAADGRAFDVSFWPEFRSILQHVYEYTYIRVYYVYYMHTRSILACACYEHVWLHDRYSHINKSSGKRLLNSCKLCGKAFGKFTLLIIYTVDKLIWEYYIYV